jgi:hypothetical protein
VRWGKWNVTPSAKIGIFSVVWEIFLPKKSSYPQSGGSLVVQKVDGSLRCMNLRHDRQWHRRLGILVWSARR